MAKLSEQLPTEQRGMIQVQESPRPAPSFLETLASFGANAIQSIDQANANNRRRKAAEAAAAEDAAKNTAARGAVYAMFGDDPAAMAAHEAAKAAAPGLVNQQEALNQGRGLNPAAVRLRSEATIRQLVGQHPGQEYVILKTLKEFNIDSYAMKEYERAETSIDNQIEDERQMEKKYADSAFELGLGNWYEMTPQERVQVTPTIDQFNRSKALFEQADRTLKMRLNQVDLDEKTRKNLEEQEGELRTRGFLDAMGPRLDSFIRSVTQIVMNPAVSDAERDKQITQLSRFAQIEFPRQFNQAMGLYGVNMTSEQRTLVQGQFDRAMKSLESLLSGPASIVEENKRQVEILKDKAKIDVMEALPFWTYLKESLGTETISTLLSNEVLSDPQVLKRLQNEFKAAINLNPGEERIRMNNLVRILKGDDKLVNLEDPRKEAPVVLKTMKELSLRAPVWNGTDSVSHGDFMRSIENAASVAVEANPQWGFSNLMNISQHFLQKGVIAGMAATTVNREDRTAAINAYQPALQSVYQALSTTRSGDKYYDLVWNNQSAQWQIKWNGKNEIKGGQQTNIVGGLAPVAPGGATAVKPAPSAAIVNQARTLNKIIDVQSRLGMLGWDPSIPAKGVSDRERRLYYGRGILPEAVKQQKAEAAKPKTQQENVDKLIQEFMSGLNATPAYQTGDIADLPSVETIRSKFAGKNNFDELSPIVEREATAAGVPLDIAFRLVSNESSWNSEADSGKAYGPMQISHKTAKLYGIEDLKSIDPIRNIKLGFRILKENYEKFGNWTDAISAYHSGRSLTNAIAGGAHDGLTSTADYVRKIVGG